MLDIIIVGDVTKILRQHRAFEQDLLLVGDVVVQRRLGDTQGLGDIVQRGIVIATGAESTRSLAQQGRAFQRKQLIPARRSEEHTSELQSLMRISYAVFCLKKKRTTKHQKKNHKHTHTSSTTIEP